MTEIIIRRDAEPRRPVDPQAVRRAYAHHYLTCSIGPRPQGADDEEGKSWCHTCWQGNASMLLTAGLTLEQWIEAYLDYLARQKPATLLRLAQRGL